MAVIVDTNVISYLFKRDTRAKLYDAHLREVTKLISFMSLAELYNRTLQNNWGSRRKEDLENSYLINTELFMPMKNSAKSGRK